jgi:galactokinase
MGTPAFEARVRAMLPEGLSGAAFLERCGPLPGLVVEPEHIYPLRAAAALAVEEHLRSRMVAALLRAAASKAQRDEDLTLAGELMARSHGAQRAAGLGDPRADALVERIYAEGAGQGLYGARAATAAAGVTLVALGRIEAEPTLRAIVEGYGREVGLPVAVWGGTSSGASVAGTREM